MRILVDTNILISAILFPHSKVAQALLYVTEHHDVILCDRNIYELREVLNRKKPDKLPDAKSFWLSFRMS
ncbi:MAG: PIN domain-containing protein [Desulfitobacteriaceae bacterium]|nr:PIN domain-containing protein [Desulfitobacteriaceae bacterium]MDD4346453.1 PIN domain-containing protein [Desulfitobacteriaceae bacterium]MDD4401932.1 PIN domain-containing protein [Desulfitobacteriaceae bacterium]